MVLGLFVPRAFCLWSFRTRSFRPETLVVSPPPSPTHPSSPYIYHLRSDKAKFKSSQLLFVYLFYCIWNERERNYNNWTSHRKHFLCLDRCIQNINLSHRFFESHKKQIFFNGNWKQLTAGNSIQNVFACALIVENIFITLRNSNLIYVSESERMTLISLKLLDSGNNC